MKTKCSLVGYAQMVSWHQLNRLPPNLTEEQRASFDHLPPNVYGFLFAHAQPLPLMPCRGKLKIFELDFDVLMDAPPPAQAGLF